MLIAAVDIGTSGTRALLFDDARFTGVAVAVEYALVTPAPGAAELDPAEVFAAFVHCLRGLAQDAPGPIECVALSAAMHSLLAVDAGGKPLMHAHTWADNRPARVAATLRATSDAPALYAETGVPIHPMSPLAKLLWLRAAAPDVHAGAAKFVSLKEWVCHRLFGRWVVDDGIASASGLYGLAARDWSARALGIAGIGADRLSRVARGETLLRLTDAGAARTLGLAVGTPFVLGGSDGCLANLGAGLLAGEARRRAVLTIGTSGALRMAVDRPAPDAAMRTFCYALGERQFVIGGATNGGGLPLRWLRDRFPAFVAGRAAPGTDPYEALTALAQTAPAGAGGLLFHPYLAGERAPLWNADARASFIGLHAGHGPAHLVRAVMEGVLFNLGLVLDVLEELAGGPVEEIVAGGGFARSAFWLQMAADLLGRPLVVAENPETTAQGAALLALAATGRARDLAAATAMLPGNGRRVVPDAATHARYRALAPIFAGLPATLAPAYAGLAAFQNDTR
ncbi:MAG: gluconokinase [Burkholderiales bacterium]|nr:gluconokinase [Burkholderiales bacterium]